ncbi:excalibur calcium-binding domain-containing protein [Sphingobium sp. WW5]|uniref:excalibur calcium-binding domain-containing protein n=1 Tax=unclassified Sphingobium TaxID=2611147 RepID=UPI003C18FD4B
MRQSPLFLVGALAVGLVGGTMLPRKSQPLAEANAPEENWTPRDTIPRDRPMSADELDQQQPSSSSSGGVARPANPPVQSGGSTWSYRNCREARAAGAAPIYRGQPGFGDHMDGDGDGIACEPYHPR